MEKALKLVENVFKPLISPIFTKLSRPLVWFKQLPTTAPAMIRKPLQAILAKKERDLDDYISFGNYYIAKRLLVYLLLAVAAIVYFVFISPPAVLLQWLDRAAVLYISDQKLPSFSGKAKLFDDQHRLLYLGGMENGLYSGTGELYRESGALMYSGEFQQGLKSGQGMAYDEKGRLTYKGLFANDTYHGQGTLLDPETGAILYEGEFANGVRSGQGKEFYPDGKVKYEGAFQNDLYNGDGKLFYPNGTIRYEGSFRNGLYAGNGTEFYENGLPKYQGFFAFNRYQGQGTLFDESGQTVFTGEFRNGQYHGNGELFYPDGSTQYTGAFQNGKYHGFGTLLDQSGNILAKGFFEDGFVNYTAFIGKTASQIEALMGKPEETIPFADADLQIPLLPGTESGTAPSAPAASAEQANSDASSSEAVDSSSPGEQPGQAVQAEPTAPAYQLYKYPLEGVSFVVKSPATPEEQGVVEKVVLLSPQTINTLVDSLEKKYQLDDAEKPSLLLRLGIDKAYYPVENYLYTFSVDVERQAASRVVIEQTETLKK